MSQYVETPTKAFASGAALAVFRRVKLSSGSLAYAGANDAAIGTLLEATFADAAFASGYTDGTVHLRTAEGTRKCVASEAITAGNLVYAAANGKVAASGSVIEGRAFEAAADDGDVIEVMSINAPGVYVPAAAQQALSGAGAVNVTTFCTRVTTTGADALTLADGVIVGQLKKIQLIVDGGDGTLTPSNLAGGTTITFADAGDYALLQWNGTDWVAIELGNDADGATAPVLA